MAVDVEIDGKTVDVDPNGVVLNRYITTEYTVSEEATPIDASDSSGAYGQFSIGVVRNSETRFLMNKEVRLADRANGSTIGYVRGISESDTLSTLTIDSRLGLMNVDRQAAPFVGTLENALLYYFGLVGITSEIVIEPAIKNRPVVLQGFSGKLWDNIKKLCIVQGVEISLVSDNVVVRRVRGRVAETYRDASRSPSIDDSQMALSVEVYYYQGSYGTGLIYPDKDDTQAEQAQTLQPRQIVEVEIQVDASLTSVEQPVAQDYVGREYRASSVYCVSGNDGKPIPAALWLARGGKIEVSVGEDTRTIKIVYTGADLDDYAPFTIGATSGSSNYYNSLRIHGTGVLTDKQLLTLPTGANPERTQQEVGATIDIPFINTLSEAYDIGVRATARWGTPARTVTFTSNAINRRGETNSTKYPTIAEFNAQYAGLSIDDFNTLYSTQSLLDFNNDQYELIADDFANQAFGNLAGARYFYNDAWYRIRSATQSPFGIQATADADTIIGDFNDKWRGKTIADFNDEWWHRPMLDFTVAPLRGDV